MEATITIKATPAEYDVLRAALEVALSQYTSRLTGGSPADIRLNRAKAARTQELLEKLR